MPVANCIITSDCNKYADSSRDLITLWANESNVSQEHMTINITVNEAQHGKKYAVMANLLLPSFWSKEDISIIQLGLAKALSYHFNLSPQDVFIATSIINSGMVVEEGQEIKW